MRKLISLILIIATLLSLSCFAGNSATTDVADTNALEYFVSDENSLDLQNDYPFGYIGDADSDYKISILDATKIQYHVAKINTLSVVPKMLSDINRDNMTDISDATLIQRYIAMIDTNSNANKILCAILTHDEEDMANFDKVVEFLKANGKSSTAYGFTDYYMDGIGIFDTTNHLYGCNYELRYEENFSLEGNKGSLLMSCEISSDQIPDEIYYLELRILRGIKTLDINYYVYTLNEDGSYSKSSAEYAITLRTGNNENTGKAEYIFATEEQALIDYFPDKERYDAYFNRFIEVCLDFCNGCIEDDTGVKLEDLI